MNQKIEEIRLIIKEKPHLIWHTSNYDALSLESMVEAVLNYGDWNDFNKLKEILGVEELAVVFKKMSQKKRSNLRLSTLNYFEKYFNKYA